MDASSSTVIEKKREWKKYPHVWRIENLEQLWKKSFGFVIESPKLCSDDRARHWNIRFFATGLNAQCRGHVSLQIVFSQIACKGPVLFKGSMAILDSNKQVIKFHSFPSRCDYEYTELKFVEKQVLKSRVKNDAIHIYSEVCLKINNAEKERSTVFERPVGELRLGEDLSNLLADNNTSDIILVCSDGKKFNAHKIILSSRSPVFSAMLQHDMLEKNSGRIEISDCSSETVQLLLRFVYSGKVHMQDFDVSMELLNAAEKYEMEDLKLLCIDYIADNLKTSNVYAVLLLSDKDFAMDLKIPAINFIVDNFEILSAAEIENISTNIKPPLLTELLLKVSKRMQEYKDSSR